MHAPFLTLRQFNDVKIATAYAEHLREHNIHCRIETDEPLIDPIFIGTIPKYHLNLRIPAVDFARAHSALESYYHSQLTEVKPDYYLNTFSDQELFEILRKPDEWGHFDYVLARRLLAERGLPIPDDTAADIKEQRSRKLATDPPAYPAPAASLSMMLHRMAIRLKRLSTGPEKK